MMRALIACILMAGFICVSALALLPAPLLAQTPPVPRGALPDELVLTGDTIITVRLNGIPLRFEVTAEAFGQPVVNPDVAERLGLESTSKRGWRFGPVVVSGVSGKQELDFGAGPQILKVAWTDRPISSVADGAIGVHHLPYKRVTFQLKEPDGGEIQESFPLKRAGGRSNTRLGAQVEVGDKRLMLIFVPERSENLITAPTANFLATHLEGGFEPESDGFAVLDFGVRRPVRTMRTAYPIELGRLNIERFAVRVEDYGTPKRVGEIAEDDPRFRDGQILVTRRKGRGKPDLLTRVGRQAVAHCSTITYDLKAKAIRLSCGNAPMSQETASEAPASP
ncbi:MAG: hypothetical protein WBA51_02010 [Erythrobacter sp.]